MQTTVQPSSARRMALARPLPMPSAEGAGAGYQRDFAGEGALGADGGGHAFRGGGGGRGKK